MLAMRSVAKSFRGRAVIHDVSLILRRGEIVGLLGPNGAGKTTSFHLLTGLIPPDTGQVLLDDHDITGTSFSARARLGLAYLPQDPFIVRDLTVEQNMELVLEAREPRAEARRQIQNSLLKEFEVSGLRKTKAAYLSGGERRRVEIALTLACAPHFMLLDEPLAGIDPIAVGHLQDIIRYLAGRRIGVLITDHRARELLSFVDRAYVISDGRVLAEGGVDALTADRKVREIYLGEEFSL
jgi:lipopolysaccharide export system ATP-binding protein